MANPFREEKPKRSPFVIGVEATCGVLFALFMLGLIGFVASVILTAVMMEGF